MDSYLWTMWTWQPPIYVSIIVLALIYTWYVRWSNRHVLPARFADGQGAAPPDDTGPSDDAAPTPAGGFSFRTPFRAESSSAAKDARRSPGNPLWFYLGLACAIIALQSPIDEIGELYLFSAHMLEHMILAFIVPPLLLLGLRNRFPAVPAWVRGPWREVPQETRSTGRLAGWLAWRVLVALTKPLVAILFFNIIFTAYHIPVLYEAGLANPMIHAVEHLAMIFAGCITFWPIFSPLPELPPLPYPVQMIYVFIDGLGMTPIFAGITFGGSPFYEWYVHAPRFPLLDVSPLEDQQLGGIVMKIGAGVVYGALLARAFYSWCRSDLAYEPSVDELLLDADEAEPPAAYSRSQSSN